MRFDFSYWISEWRTRLNYPELGRIDEAALWRPWVTPERADSNSACPRLSGKPRLLVVVMTYGRPGPCARVLEHLRAALAQAGIAEHAALAVFHDACGQDYSEPRALVGKVAAEVHWFDARERQGKMRFWRTYQLAFCLARDSRAARVLFLHDDLEFAADMLVRAEALWAATASDPRRRVLYLFSSSEDEPNGRWVDFPRRDLPGQACRQINWFDLQAFMVDAEFFRILKHRLVPIPLSRWEREPTVSSGVGRQLTRRLRGRANTYQAWPPLVSHGAEPSVANPEARQANTLDNRADYQRADYQRADHQRADHQRADHQGTAADSTQK